MSTAPEKKKRRATYRHGDLRRELLDAGIELARVGGPDAVVLREATRRAGVSPNAAYRHFASQGDLLRAVRAAALSRVALAMEAELAQVDAALSGADLARARVRAVGTGYMRFAREEPGLFHTAFSRSDDAQGEADVAFIAEKAGNSGLDPYQLLSATLDDLVQANALPAERRRGAEYLAWSAVHGLSLLMAQGPLRQMSREQQQVIETRLLDMVENGL
jgi:AcrR family transcriptional regulator